MSLVYGSKEQYRSEIIMDQLSVRFKLALGEDHMKILVLINWATNVTMFAEFKSKLLNLSFTLISISSRVTFIIIIIIIIFSSRSINSL